MPLGVKRLAKLTFLLPCRLSVLTSSSELLAMAISGLLQKPFSKLPHPRWLLFTRLFNSSQVFEPSSSRASYPAFVVWGANTNVGKTLVSAGLASSIVRGGPNLLYLKPVQTGFPQDSDSDSVVNKVTQVLTNNVSSVPRKVYVSSCIQKASPAVLKEKMENSQEIVKMSPLLDRISIKHAENSGMEDLFRYKGFLLEANSEADGMWRARKAICGEEYQKEDADRASSFIATTMWSWYHAVSPHLAAAQEGCIVSDSTLLQALRNSLWNFPQAINGSEAASSVAEVFHNWAIIETAGGVASPGPSGTLQCDLYRPLRLPGILVGDGKLGGISSTITAYESLHIRGYDIAAIVLTDCGLANEEPLLTYLHQRVPVMILPSIPEDPDDTLVGWFLQSGKVFSELQRILEKAYSKRMQRLQNMKKMAGQLLWWPFTQHSLVPDDAITVIDSRCGDSFMIYKHAREGKVMTQQFDACASWWTQGPDAKLQPELARQIGYAAGRFGHVMLPENVYEPALRCAELLLQSVGKGWADRVYYSDNGSTAVEIAIKMAFRKYLSDHNLLCKSTSDMVTINKNLDLKVLALKGSYHGDTLGAQDAQAPSAYTGFLQQPWYQGRGLILDPPYIYLQNRQWHIYVPDCYKKCNSGFLDNVQSNWTSRDELFHEQRENSELASIYKDYISKQLSLFVCTDVSTHVAALIIEPVIHGAGGMTLIDPLFQRLLVNECKAKKIPVIFDEVFAGCWRLGAQSAAELIGCTPDIGCYSKLLTGGTVPLAVTLASSSVFGAFQGPSKLFALLHGHSYSGHAVGCQAAVTSLQWFGDPERNPNLLSCKKRMKELWEPEIVSEISTHPAVQRVISLGTVFALELKTDASRVGYSSMSAKSIVQGLREDGVYVRPLGNVVYLMCGPTTPPSTCSKILWTLFRHLDAYLEAEQNQHLPCHGF